MLNCTIVALTQEMDLEANATHTYLVLRLSNGEKVRAAVGEDVAAKVVAMSVHANGQPSPAMRIPEGGDYALPEQGESRYDDSSPGALVQQPTASGGNETFVFGGEDDTPAQIIEEPAPAPVAPVVQPAQPQLQNRQVTAAGVVIVPSKSVPAQTGGMPAARKGGVDPADFTGGTGADSDEDGIGSI